VPGDLLISFMIVMTDPAGDCDFNHQNRQAGEILSRRWVPETLMVHAEIWKGQGVSPAWQSTGFLRFGYVTCCGSRPASVRSSGAGSNVPGWPPPQSTEHGKVWKAVESKMSAADRVVPPKGSFWDKHAYLNPAPDRRQRYRLPHFAMLPKVSQDLALRSSISTSGEGSCPIHAPSCRTPP
jgi:hypothetical protein